MLGKRKRDTAVVKGGLKSPDPDHLSRADGTAHDIFRKYFEAQFDPLPELSSSTSPVDIEASDNASNNSHYEDQLISEDEFAGFSDDEQAELSVIEVIDTAPGIAQDGNAIDKIFMKSFMSSKPPREIEPVTQTKSKNSQSSLKEVEDDATNLKNDLDLQRLLRESHLLSQNTSNLASNATSLHGKHRHQATDLRMLDLGSKQSLFTQEKMPMNHRKGIRAKASATEVRRRRDAKENGVILEKAKGKKDTKNISRRERGVDVPVLGKFKGGTLSLSKKDIASIQGPSGSAGRRKGRR